MHIKTRCFGERARTQALRTDLRRRSTVGVGLLFQETVMGHARSKAKPATHAVERADRSIARTTGRRRTSSLVQAASTISDLADQPPLIALSAATLVAGIVTGRRRLAWTGLHMLASHWLATQAKNVVKRRIDRTRPFVMLGGDAYHARKGHSAAKRENSFPSGHTAGAVAVARAVAQNYPASAPLGYTAAATAAAVQLPRGAHYLSDVLVGAAIGWIADMAIRFVLPSPDRSGQRPHPGRSSIEVQPSGELGRDRLPARHAGRVAGGGERTDPLGDMPRRAVTIAPLDSERLGKPLLLE